MVEDEVSLLRSKSTRAMVRTNPSKGDLAAATRDASATISTLILAASDLERPVPRSEWSAADTATHIAETQAIFADLVAGGSNPYPGPESRHFADMNARLLTLNPDRDAARLATAIGTATERLIEAAEASPSEKVCASPLGPMELTSLLSYCMCHLLIHGHGIARATGQSSPITQQHLRLAMPFLAHATTFAYANRQREGVDACVEFHLRGSFSFWMDFTPERAGVRYTAGRKPDCHILTDPVSFLLVFFGHESPMSLTLQGRALAWGRRPWMALKITDWLPSI
jgi:uncharacterized protein (TIGR03083 family)